MRACYSCKETIGSRLITYTSQLCLWGPNVTWIRTTYIPLPGLFLSWESGMPWIHPLGFLDARCPILVGNSASVSGSICPVPDLSRFGYNTVSPRTPDSACFSISWQMGSADLERRWPLARQGPHATRSYFILYHVCTDVH